MLVHGARAGEKLAERAFSDGDHQRQADGRPQRIAPADPVPEAEDAGLVEAELRHLVERGGDGGEMLRHGVFAKSRDDEVARGGGIGHGLDGGEGL